MSLQSIKSDNTETNAIEQLKNTLDLLSKGMLRLKLFFFWYVYEHIPIYYNEKIKFEGMTDGKSIYLSKGFLETNFHNQLFILLHEILHIVYSHNKTMLNKLKQSKTVLEKNITRIVYNVIADAVINSQIINIFNSSQTQTKFIEEKYVNPEIINKLLESDISKLGFALAIDRLLYLINTGTVELNAFTESGKTIDLTTTDLDTLRNTNMIFVRFINKKTGAEVMFNLHLDLSFHGSDYDESPNKGSYDSENIEDSIGGSHDSENIEESIGGKGKEGKEKNGSSIKNYENNTAKESTASNSSGYYTPTHRDKSILIKKPIKKSIPNEADIKKIIRDAIDFDKAKRDLDKEKSAGAGFFMDSMYELIDTSSRKPKWIDKIRIFVTDYLGNFKIYSWQKVHKRSPYLKPGYYRMNIPHIIILLDTSGSMLDESLNKALIEIFGLIESVPDLRVTLYQWSSKCSLPEKVDRYFVQRVKTHRKIPVLTGGTEITPALDTVLPTITKNDLVVIMTDGYIYDIDNGETQKKLGELAKKSAKTLFVTVSAIPKLPKGIEVIKIED